MTLSRPTALVVSLATTTTLGGLVAAPAGAGPGDCAIPTIDDRCEAWTSIQDTSTRETSWNGNGYEAPTALVASADRVFATGYSAGEEADDPLTVAFDAASGAKVWSSRLPGVAGSSDSGFAIALSPDESVVYTAGRQGSKALLAAHDTADGHVLWTSLSDKAASWSHVTTGAPGDPVYVSGIQNPAGGAPGVVIAAHDPQSGERLWSVVREGGGTDTDSPRGIAVSPSGDRVFVLALVRGPDGTLDYVTRAYEAADPQKVGKEVWAAAYTGGAGADAFPYSLVLAPDSRRVFVTGHSTGINTPNPFRWWDYVTVAYDTRTGVQEWVARYDSLLHLRESARDIVASPDGQKVFVTGVVDEGPGVFATDVWTVAYDASTGGELWTSRYSGPGNSNDVADFLEVDPDGEELYVGAHTYPTLTTIALDTEMGSQTWVARYNGFGLGIAGQLASNYSNDMALSPNGGRLFNAGVEYLARDPDDPTAGSRMSWGIFAYEI